MLPLCAMRPLFARELLISICVNDLEDVPLEVEPALMAQIQQRAPGRWIELDHA
jgi:hypothetical protein